MHHNSWNFEIKSHIKWGPEAAGLVEELDGESGPLGSLTWGLSHQYVSYNWQYIKRFEIKMPRNP